MGVDVSTPKVINLRAYSNPTAMLLAYLDHQCYDKGSFIALQITRDQLEKESRSNQYSATLTESLKEFIETAHASTPPTGPSTSKGPGPGPEPYRIRA